RQDQYRAWPNHHLHPELARQPHRGRNQGLCRAGRRGARPPRGRPPGGLPERRKHSQQSRALTDDRWMAAAIALGERGRGLTAPNPNVGCLIVQDGKVVGEGWTQPGGRPHAEAVALAQAADAARGATVYTTLEPCAHVSDRGPACAILLAEAHPAKVVIGVGDPDPRTNGHGI